jgi:cell division protein FtsQ
LPDTVYVRLEERKPFALWQEGRKVLLIDQGGAVLTDQNLNSFQDLMRLKGRGAPAHGYDLARLLAAEPQIKSRLDYALRIEDRRWDLVLKGDRVIKLPEKDIGLAMRSLVVQHEKEGLLDKPFTSLDVRDPARLTLRTEVGRAQDLAVNLAEAGQSL